MFSAEQIQHFVAMIDRAIAIAEERIKLQAQGGEDKAPPGALAYVVKGLLRLRDEAASDKLSPSEGRVTIGILREVGDWGETVESELFKAARDLEGYYLDKMK